MKFGFGVFLQRNTANGKLGARYPLTSLKPEDFVRDVSKNVRMTALIGHMPKVMSESWLKVDR